MPWLQGYLQKKCRLGKYHHPQHRWAHPLWVAGNRLCRTEGGRHPWEHQWDPAHWSPVLKNLSEQNKDENSQNKSIWNPSSHHCWLPHSPRQCTPASSLWEQSPYPQGSAWQAPRDSSLPRHPTSSSHTGPEPGPKAAFCKAATAGPQPSCRHTTSASARSQESSHTVPHEPPCHSSTRPEQPFSPPSTRSVPSSGKMVNSQGMMFSG